VADLKHVVRSTRQSRIDVFHPLDVMLKICWSNADG
jgi:hypothetical protein